MIHVGGRELTSADFVDVLFRDKQIVLDEKALENVAENFRFLRGFSSDKLIYGINTGFGPMAQYKVSEENLLQLQYNLIRSHASGGGNLMPPVLVRALMIARLNSLMQGYSGVHIEVAELLKHLINRNIIPCIYEHGGVG